MGVEPSSSNLLESVDICISQVEIADSRIGNIAWKLNAYEKEVFNISESKPEESVQILLEGLSEVKEDYKKLRQELYEVHELQRYVQDSIRQKTHDVHARYRELCMKLASRSFTE